MTRGIKLVAAFLACLVTANGVPTLFPQGKTLIYKYYGDVKAGIIEPAAYASQYAISGKLHITHDSSDPSIRNAYQASLTDVKTGLHNGLAQHFQTTAVNISIPAVAKVIEDPFLIVYNDVGQLEGVKIPENEAGWSRNMKQAIASMLQLDLANMKLDEPFKPLSFISQEKSIQGDCWTTYDIHQRDSKNQLEDNQQLTVYKFSSPRNCSNYSVHKFNHVDIERCSLPPEAPMNMASRRVFQLEKEGSSILINSLIAHGGANYFPWKGRSEAHYVLNNASFVLDSVISSSEGPSMVDFKNIPLTSDLSYQRPKSNYGQNTAVDLTHGRHQVQQSHLIDELKKLLVEAAEYLDENHLDTKEPDFKHGQAINRILYTMGYMEVASLHEVFNGIAGTFTQRDLVIKDLFLGIVPRVGTTASCIFIKNVIKSKSVSQLTAIGMLTNLPMNVRVPDENLLLEMKELVEPALELKPDIRKSAILCLSSLVHRTFKDSKKPEDIITLKTHLSHLYNNLLKEESYDMKIVYLMAIENVEIGNIHELLTPIIRGDISVSEKPMYIRLLAIWAVKKSLANDYNAAHDLLWPIMADYSLPLKLRIAAYDILIRQAPTMTNILHIYWFMVYEKSQHLYNYHHTTIKGLANSVDPCDYQLRELTTKIMRFTKIHSTVPYKLSASYMIDSFDDVYGHGEKFGYSLVLNEVTGEPEVIHLEYISMDGRKPVKNLEIYLHIEGYNLLVDYINPIEQFAVHPIGDTKIRNILLKAAENLPPVEKSLHLDVIILEKGRVAQALHYNSRTLMQFMSDMCAIIGSQSKHLFISKALLTYDYLYEHQIVSEMGLPVVLENRIPKIYSFKLQWHVNPATDTLELQFVARVWRHGDYSMSIYNPMTDVWHSIKRSTALDVTIPIKVNIDVDLKAKTLKISFPKLGENSSISGAKIHAKDMTTITENENDVLAEICPNCNHHEVVSKGPNAKKLSVKTHHSKDIGLQYTSAIFDCENEISRVSIRKDWLRAMTERMNTWSSTRIHTILEIRQQLRNYLISAPMGSCGSLIKAEASTVYPTSRVDVMLGANFQETDNDTLHLLPGKELNIRGSIDAIAESTNTPARSWDFNANLTMSTGHIKSALQIQLTRKTPGEKNLNICIDGEKKYSESPEDPLKFDINKEMTNTKLSISMSQSDDDLCNHNNPLVDINIKGEVSDEQKKLFNEQSINSGCKRDINNPLYNNSRDLLPRTVNCLDETMKFTTLRKYTVNISHNNVPPHIVSEVLSFEDSIRATALSNIEYKVKHVDPATAIVVLEFPINDETLNVSVATPSRSYDLTDLDLTIDNDPRRHIGFGFDNNKHLWTPLLDNTRFNGKFLSAYISNEMKMCSVYPKITLTLDRGEISDALPKEYTLAMGNIVSNNLAIFVKSIDDKVAVKIYNANQTVEVLPSDSGVQVKINEEILDDMDKGSLTPPNELNWILKVTKHADEIAILLQEEHVLIIYRDSNVSIFVKNQLQGQISGRCGNMIGT